MTSQPILSSPPNDMPVITLSEAKLIASNKQETKTERDNLVPSVYVLNEIKKRHKLDDAMKFKFSLTHGDIVKGLGFKIDYDTLHDILKDLDLIYDKEIKYLVDHAVPRPRNNFFLFKIFDMIFKRN